MDYEEELDDNGVLRVRRVASPFVPIRDEREDEREAPRMAFDDDQMKAFFKDCGEVSSIRWLTDRDTQQFKGCGFVEFADPDASLDKAAKKNGEMLLGRQVRLDYAAPRAPKAAW